SSPRAASATSEARASLFLPLPGALDKATSAPRLPYRCMRKRTVARRRYSISPDLNHRPVRGDSRVALTHRRSRLVAMLERLAQSHRLVEADVVAALPRLRRYARVLTGDDDRADALVEETLASAWRSRRAWDGESNARTWLFGLMHRLHGRKPR